MSNQGKTKIKDNDKDWMKKKQQDKKKAQNLRKMRKEKDYVPTKKPKY